MSFVSVIHRVSYLFFFFKFNIGNSLSGPNFVKFILENLLFGESEVTYPLENICFLKM